jgi:hypothetical protein
MHMRSRLRSKPVRQLQRRCRKSRYACGRAVRCNRGSPRHLKAREKPHCRPSRPPLSDGPGTVRKMKKRPSKAYPCQYSGGWYGVKTRRLRGVSPRWDRWRGRQGCVTICGTLAPECGLAPRGQNQSPFAALRRGASMRSTSRPRRLEVRYVARGGARSSKAGALFRNWY